MNAAFARLKALFPKSFFARNVAVLAGGTAVGQAIVVLAPPILMQLYDFGLDESNCSFVTVLSTLDPQGTLSGNPRVILGDPL